MPSGPECQFTHAIDFAIPLGFVIIGLLPTATQSWPLKKPQSLRHIPNPYRKKNNPLF